MIHILFHKFYRKKKTFERANYKRNHVQRNANAESLENWLNIQRASEIECNVTQFEMDICVWIMRIIPVQILILVPNNSKPTQNEIHWNDDIKLNISYGNIFVSRCGRRVALALKGIKCKYCPFSQNSQHNACERTKKWMMKKNTRRKNAQ